jgi:hypothetical protein
MIAMIKGILNTDQDEFRDAFNSEMKDRVASKFAEKHFEISQSVMKPEVEEPEIDT